jgi:hypothetical protein
MVGGAIFSPHWLRRIFFLDFLMLLSAVTGVGDYQNFQKYLHGQV